MQPHYFREKKVTREMLVLQALLVMPVLWVHREVQDNLDQKVKLDYLELPVQTDSRVLLGLQEQQVLADHREVQVRHW